MEAMESSVSFGVCRGREPEGPEGCSVGDPSSALRPEPGPGDGPGSDESRDASGAAAEPADAVHGPARSEVGQEQAAEMAERLAAVEASAEELRRMVDESERARCVDRELLVAGVVELDAARECVEAQVRDGATVLEAVSRVRERKPLFFAARGRAGVRATGIPAADREGDDTIDAIAEAASQTGDRGLLLRYLRLRRGG